MKEQVEKIGQHEHILLRPDSYVGVLGKSVDTFWVRNENKFEQKMLSVSLGLWKIFDEILVNAEDRNTQFPSEVTSISTLVDRENGIISIENNGPLGGICVQKHPKENIWNPELTFGHLLTSTNYKDNKKVVGGRNGYGAKLANIFSTEFVVDIKDSENHVHYVQKWKNNMKTCHPPRITKYVGAKSTVNVVFKPDWARFEMTGLDEDFYKIIEKRMYDAVVCTTSTCKVSFMGKIIKKMTTEKYAKMYLEDDVHCVSLNTDRWSVTVAPSDNGFQQVSFVNGICTTQGGTHVDHVASQITAGIIEELGKKIKLRPQFVKNTFFVFVKSTIEDPTFSSQVKSQCTLKASKFGSSFVLTKPFLKNILKTGVQTEVLAVSKFREQKELKKTDGGKKSKVKVNKLDDAHSAGTANSSKCTIIFTEGDSAKTLAVAGLSVVGRDHYGVFPLRGKCKNVRDASVKQLMANQEFSDIKTIIGLQQEKTYTSLGDLRYGRMMIMSDQDDDGSHIKGLILNMIETFWPSLIELGFVVSMVTPRVKATRGKTQLSFFTNAKYQEWYKENPTGWTIKYYKGLGTSTSREAQEYFKNITRLTVRFEADENAHESLLLAFDKTLADNRKTWLLESSKTNPSDLEVAYGEITTLPVSSFIRKDLVNFSLADLHRSVAHMVDGQKPSQRKILYACFKRKLVKEMKVAQLAAYTAELTSYHHGETSLADTIVKIAHDFVGSNNVNFLVPKGQFGTRLMSGKDASQTRYINTYLTPQARCYFDARDDPVLNYLEDDGKFIEPEYFVPVLPTVLVNGTEGIGTGFSTDIPSFNPADIKENILRIINQENIKTMTPYFNGFKGTITPDPESNQIWTATGVWKKGSRGRISVTELPPGRWTQDFKEHLDDLVEKKIISEYLNNSTTEEVNFDIFDYSGNNLVKDFKMSKTIRTTNMHLFHPTQGIKKYSTPEEILVDFVEIRLQYYKKRKHNLLKDLFEREVEIRNKSEFIRQVVNDEFIIFKRKKITIESELLEKKFQKINESYDYLLNIKTHQYTEEAIEKLTLECTTISEELKTLKATSHVAMWKSDVLKC